MLELKIEVRTASICQKSYLSSGGRPRVKAVSVRTHVLEIPRTVTPWKMDSSRERDYKRKRWMSFIIVLSYLFLGGCEYVVILPTVWDYLQTLGVTEEHWLGFTVSTYSTAAAISSLIGGRLADKYYKHTKLLVIAFISFRVIGNFQYMLGMSVWNILCGRMLCEKKEESSDFRKYLNDFLTDSFVVLMSLVFALFFSQMAFETVIPVITQDNFGFGVRENTFIYMAGGIEALLTYVGIAFIGKYLRETTLQFLGWFLILSAQVWLIIVMPHFEKGNQTHLVYFLIGIFLVFLGSPIAAVGNSALSSKVLSDETQGLGQGIRRVIIHLGLIFGPTWAGATVMKPHLFLGVGITLMLINGVMLMVSFKSLRQAEDKMTNSTQAKPLQSHDESSPLLPTEP
ncbi:unnamed protein product [Allacma fusca]|uniref:Major facilitator superfamily (MFS) profile domain-containing protein n=1 Tax=Allacma fusca TaxID=39272 RepID=A0A8J2K2K2_9HEXA|nr:unnamed protein product [Allacma fusca]